MAGTIAFLLNLMANLWNGLGAPLRRGVVWLTHAKFVHGVSGVIMDGRGRVLLLKHRFWNGQRWGLPGGLARRGESLGATLRRELREEAGVDVRAVKLLRVNISQGWVSQFIVLAQCDGEPRAISPEIMDARFWEVGELPENLLPGHRELIEASPGMGEWPGLPLEE
jgi:ADP-ribose pyrophosphatase YjhB (NUDIX family)